MKTMIRLTTRGSAAIYILLLLAAGPNLSPGQALKPWADRRTAGRFTFHADFDLNRYKILLEQMTQLQYDLSQALEIGDFNESIDVYLFSQKTTYHQYMQRYFPGIPTRRAMFVKSQSPGNVFAYQTDQLGVDLRHECTHALLHAALPYVPLWLDEGLAEYFEMPQIERTSNNPHLKAIRWHLRFRNPPPLEQLEKIRELTAMGRGEYRDAWAWVHFMLHGPPEARRELIRFLADLQNHSPGPPLAVRLQQRLPDAQRQFVDHFKRWKG